MSAVQYCFIEPLDVLFLRGNKLFGDPGSYGECLIPPWPSVAAGAIRSRMLVDAGIDLAEFGKGRVEHPALGTPDQPGSFTVAAFHLARRAGQRVEILTAPPADLVIDEQCNVSALAPQSAPTGLQSSSALPLLPVLAQGNKRSKAATGYWLTQSGWEAYLRGELPMAEQLVHSSKLWVFDARVGIGMSADTHSVEEGKLFSAQAIAMKKEVGFVAAVAGAEPPSAGLLRFGGDGRAASISRVDLKVAEPDYQSMVQAGRCRLVLTTPGLFADGWKLPGTDSANRVSLPGISARLACAAVPRAETISGWDLANWQPKPAQRVAPTGSVYWLDELEATPEALRKLAECGLWGTPCEDRARRAEGFNRVAIGAWS